MICYHHNDMDGKSAGYLVHKLKPSSIEDYPENYISSTYDDILNKHTLIDDVFIVDISFTEASYENLIKICRTAKTVTWIDHHASSEELVKHHYGELQAQDNLTYFISSEACGSALTYAYLNLNKYKLMEIRNTYDGRKYDIKASYKEGGIISVTMTNTLAHNPKATILYKEDITLPRWLYHIDDFDAWKQLDKRSNDLILGLDMENTAVRIYDKTARSYKFNPFWDMFTGTDESVLEKYIEDGSIINRYITSKYIRELPYTSFEWEYEGITFLCKNGYGNSFNFDYMLDKYPACILFNYSGKSGKWEYSVYSGDESKFDCSKFCQKFGGGGHFHASGFSTDMLIFTHRPNKKNKEPIIFLGGTIEGEDKQGYRYDFIKQYKKKNNTVVELFNPVVENWSRECIEKENQIKQSAMLNLFVITPGMKGPYSCVEAVECASYSNVYFAVYDKESILDPEIEHSLNAVGELVEKKGGKYKVYRGIDSMTQLVNDVIAEVSI